MILEELKKITQPIFFVTNDVSRGIGLENVLPNYHIICLDDHPLVDLLQNNGVSVFCLEKALGNKNTLFRSTGIILEHPFVLKYIKEKAKGQKPNIIFFKPLSKIEAIAKKNNFHLIGNKSKIAKKFENKIEFYKIAVRENLPVLNSDILEINKVVFELAQKKFGLPFVVQFGVGWAGSSTFFIGNSKQLEEIKIKFGKTKAKLSRFINGVTLINNAVVMKNQILQSNPAIQIKPNSILTSAIGGTGGRQWPAEVEEKQVEKINEITQKVGKIMGKNGYLGYFGLDFILEESSGNIFLSEINARLTASSSFYTKLEINNNVFPLLASHLLSFIKERPENFEINDYFPEKIFGSEIVGRNISSKKIEVEKSFKPGIYDLNLTTLKSDYFLNKPPKNALWLTAVAEGRKVNPEIEMFRINTFDQVCDTKGNLLPDYLSIVEKLRTKIKFN